MKSSGDYVKSIDIRCKCGKLCNYTPKDTNTLPKQSRAWCSNCKTQIYIKRSKLINSDRFNRLGENGKIQENLGENGKTSDKK
ncbi:MAG TPA: hypothetical protein VMZ91_13815, partial [Candidatus Paceibacterota bacterium]|nr:hypothetical protein [Candidatus Paceibacterota bacterium]